MASYHCTVRVGKKGNAAKHAAYIVREGEYSRQNYDLEATASGNMPKWAKEYPAHFWAAADRFERVNGSTYREIEVALPRELSPEQRIKLVEDFVDKEIGDRHAYQWAIHCPKAALEGGEQPHAHIMYSERTVDSIKRDPEQYFKRHNAKHPEKGGCFKDSAGTRERLLATRELWAECQNVYLSLLGHDARVDHRSLKDQGIDREPGRHLGRRRAAILRSAREAREELSAAMEELAVIMGERRIDEERVTATAEKMEDAVSPAEIEKQRIEGMTAAELEKEIERLRPSDIREMAFHDPAVRALDEKKRILAQQHGQAKQQEIEAARRVEQWRENHPTRIKTRFRLGDLVRLEEEASRARARVKEVGEEVSREERHFNTLYQAALDRVNKEQAPIRARIAGLEAIRREKEREKARAKMEKTFAAYARQREIKAFGWSDTSEDWRCTPPGLRTAIDRYNTAPKEERANILKKMFGTPGVADLFVEMVAERDRNIRENDRGR